MVPAVETAGGCHSTVLTRATPKRNQSSSFFSQLLPADGVQLQRHTSIQRRQLCDAKTQLPSPAHRCRRLIFSAGDAPIDSSICTPSEAALRFSFT